MGRWSQRRRAGGGPPSFTAENRIIEAVLTSIDVLDLTYAATVDASVFNLANFTTLPGGTNPATFTTLDATHFQLNFGVDISSDTTLEYDGVIPGFESPQDVTIT